jgi:hypothetical protein
MMIWAMNVCVCAIEGAVVKYAALELFAVEANWRVAVPCRSVSDFGDDKNRKYPRAAKAGKDDPQVFSEFSPA